MNYYQFHIGDYYLHTRGLTPIEDLIYRRLLDLYYQTEKPLVGDIKVLAKDLELRGKEKAIEYILDKFFVKNSENCFENKRAQKEIDAYHAKADKARIAGKASGASRKSKAYDAESHQYVEHKSNGCSTVVKQDDALCSTNQEPITKNQEPITKNHLNTIPHQQAGAPATFELVVPDSLKAKKPLDPDEQQGCREAWAGYAQAYQERYAVAPVRNAAVNAKVKQLVKRLGRDEAPGVCRFYVESVNDAFVVKKMHDMGLLLQGCEGYRTQWITGKAVTGESAKRVEKTQDFSDKMDEISAMIDQQQRAAQ